MTDIVERIRSLRYVHVPAASGLMAEAAAEIERLRLTDAEREAVEWFASLLWGDVVQDGTHAATLRSLLERLK
jgi:hypothetical protein